MDWEWKVKKTGSALQIRKIAKPNKELLGIKVVPAEQNTMAAITAQKEAVALKNKQTGSLTLTKQKKTEKEGLYHIPIDSTKAEKNISGRYNKGKISTYALLSLGFALIAALQFFNLGALIFAILAILLGLAALSVIKRKGKRGRGFAIAGLCIGMGIILFVMVAFFIEIVVFQGQ